MAITNNDILRRIRYTFNLNDSKMISIFAAADYQATRGQISDWMKKDTDDDFKPCPDVLLATFLNGFINEKRGKKEGPQPQPEKELTNNIIFRKVRIALNLSAEDVLDLLELVDMSISKHELSALFRKPTHKHYRQCQDQMLRRFFKALQIVYRPDENNE